MISFKRLAESDLHNIERWFKMEHVKRWWDTGESWKESYEKYVSRTSSDTVFQYIVSYDNTPIGYIQYYYAAKVGDGWWTDYHEDVVGIDLYIGEEEYLGRGLGKKLIREFISFIKSDDIKKVIADPSPANARVISCLKSIGFINCGEIDTPDGRAVLMEYSIK